jgi:hypothetical protein
MEAVPCARYAWYMAPFAGNCKEAGKDARKMSRGRVFWPRLASGRCEMTKAGGRLRG